MIEIVATATRLGATIRHGWPASELAQRSDVRDDDCWFRILSARLADSDVPVLDRHGRHGNTRFGTVRQVGIDPHDKTRLLARAHLDQSLARYFAAGWTTSLSMGFECAEWHRSSDGVIEVTDAVINEVSLCPVPAMPDCSIHSVRQL